MIEQTARGLAGFLSARRVGVGYPDEEPVWHHPWQAGSFNAGPSAWASAVVKANSAMIHLF
ncbi:hypothetical protein MPLSOD_270017 [Mesorhizobium sp. SOD10]|nr:hypothetical protein MPLSOD_270017 [Mesorhizobium sp. SOD10]